MIAAATLGGGSAGAAPSWELSPGDAGSGVRCSLSFGDPAAPVRSFLTIGLMPGDRMVFLVRQPDATYGEFVPYTVTLRSRGGEISLPATPISSAFLLSPLDDRTDPGHRFIATVNQPFDVAVVRSGKPLGPTQHAQAVPFELGHRQVACFRTPAEPAPSR